MSEQNNRGRRSQGRNHSKNNRGNRNHNPQPVKLSLWQKILKTIGLYKEETPKNTKSHSSNKSSRSQSNNKGNKSKGGRRKPQVVPVTSPRLYVGNLSYDATEADIEELFKGVGTVKKAEIIYNKHTHRSKGYGFVQMLNSDEAKRAVDVLNEQTFMGRKLIVNGSKARKPNDKSGDSNAAA